MTPHQWERVKRLFHEALAWSLEERSARLERECEGDREVAAEVARLVAAHLAAGSFIETPVTDPHEEAPRSQARRSGSWMGEYRLDARLGVGGMGEVYQAIDSELGRVVAIKMVGGDKTEAHARLRREARHASALNHPNICTIHHVGDHAGRPFIVMEFVEGRSLCDTRILQAARTQYIPPFALAQLHVKLGHYDRAFECLEQAYDERSNGMAYLNIDDVFTAIRSDPRYHDLLRRVGLVR